MPRIEPLTDDQATGQAAELFGAITQKVGKVPNLYRTLGQAPSVLAGLLQLGEALDGGSLSAPVKEQIALRVANRNGCDYCESAHTAIGKMVGLSEDQTISARQGNAEDAKTQASLALVDAILEREGFVTDDQLHAAQEAGISGAEVLEITGQVIKNFFTNFVNHIAQTEVDFPVIKELQEV
ncbi:MAG: carboxymuconolactone decarboxylase family protein [Phycisphaeraceae bacterium]|nr:carboxymuconolactone decarboxylase family protein [Phycisphaeraceae bacterium]